MQKTIEILNGVVDLETSNKGQFVLTVTEYIMDKEKISKIVFDKADTFLKLSEPMEAACNGKVHIIDDSLRELQKVERIIVKSKLHNERQYQVYFIDFLWGEEQGKQFKFIEPEYEGIRALASEFSKIKRVSL
jgi:hypothetical protein